MEIYRCVTERTIVREWVNTSMSRFLLALPERPSRQRAGASDGSLLAQTQHVTDQTRNGRDTTMKTTVETDQATKDNGTFTSLEIEIEELEQIAAPSGIDKLAVNHNETFVVG
jgi:hypothetical protein